MDSAPFDAYERKPFKVIIRREDGEPYLVRWNLVQLRWFTIKLHKILKSDDACLHDHPWSFLSIILRGGYVEHTEDAAGNRRVRLCHPYSILFRPAEWRHRLEIYQTCWTLVFTSRRVRQWGFWTRTGWIEWFRYRQGSNQC